MEEEAWSMNPGGGIMEEESGRRNHGGGSMGEESWRRNHGGDNLRALWRASGRYLRDIWRHPEASEGTLRDLWETRDRLEGQGGSGRENGPKSLIFTANMKKGTIPLQSGEPDMQKPL